MQKLGNRLEAAVIDVDAILFEESDPGKFFSATKARGISRPEQQERIDSNLYDQLTTKFYEE